MLASMPRRASRIVPHAMTITTNDMDIYANAFPNSLTGAALDWYMELPPNCIDSYDHTADAFISKYNTSIANKQDEEL
ncbi:hypothetical protein LIER_13089 [Lithospermum erythrorhizon]|uniref:Retrotransposon gag domain-containing protein n=1 Tax=Lithospermum erythrorhizon TaxID=34254 RepID=A0AAV3PUJ4_LITER